MPGIYFMKRKKKLNMIQWGQTSPHWAGSWLWPSAPPAGKRLGHHYLNPDTGLYQHHVNRREASAGSGDVAAPARLSFPTSFMQPFPWASLREARPVRPVPSEGVPSLSWNLVHCPSLPMRDCFSGGEGIERWCHRRMSASQFGNNNPKEKKKDETIPISCLASLKIAV